jgi:hypothetical protein
VSNVLTIQNEPSGAARNPSRLGCKLPAESKWAKKGLRVRAVWQLERHLDRAPDTTQIQTRTLLTFMKVADVPSSGQTNILVYSSQQQPAGTMDVRQTATQNNGAPVTNTCSASPCEIAIVCAGEGCTPFPQLKRVLACLQLRNPLLYPLSYGGK